MLEARPDEQHDHLFCQDLTAPKALARFSRVLNFTFSSTETVIHRIHCETSAWQRCSTHVRHGTGCMWNWVLM